MKTFTRGFIEKLRPGKCRMIIFMLILAFALTVTGCGKKKDKQTTAGGTVVTTEKTTEKTTSGKSTNEAKTEASTAETLTTEKLTTEKQATEALTTEKPTTEKPATEAPATEAPSAAIDEDGEYYSKDDVALYIHVYGKLPKNYITKNEARELGWNGGALEEYAPGKCIGGDRFGNYEGNLPEKAGRKYTECDIDTKGTKRGAKRIIFSNDGLIYYTEDHYNTFELLYGEE